LAPIVQLAVMRTSAFLAVALALAFATPAVAQEEEDINRRVEELATSAHADYLVGDYLSAAKSLLEAYQLRPVTKLLFNVARAYDKAGAAKRAVRYYERFLQAEDRDEKLARKARRSLDVLKASLASSGSAAVAGGGATSSSGRDEDWDNSLPAYALFGVAGLALVTGVAFGLSAKGAEEQFGEAFDPARRRSLADKATSAALAADISYSVALAAALGGYLMMPIVAEAGAGLQPWVPSGSPGVGISLSLNPRK